MLQHVPSLLCLLYLCDAVASRMVYQILAFLVKKNMHDIVPFRHARRPNTPGIFIAGHTRMMPKLLCSQIRGSTKKGVCRPETKSGAFLHCKKIAFSMPTLLLLLLLLLSQHNKFKLLIEEAHVLRCFKNYL